MADRDRSSPDGDHRVLLFRRARAAPRPSGASPVADLKRYERDGAPDDYRHRMLVNVAAFVFVAGLIVAGLWIAQTMATMRKNEDCVLSGRRGCTPVEVEQHRW